MSDKDCSEDQDGVEVGERDGSPYPRRTRDKDKRPNKGGTMIGLQDGLYKLAGQEDD